MMNQAIKAGLVALTFTISSYLSFSQLSKAQKPGQVPHGWHLMDKNKDGFYGISMDQAYEFVKSKNLKSNPVIVAVIDSGVDTLHEDLKSILWKNPKEIPGNGKDDDGNGYIDDVYGWNFIGAKDGRNLSQDSDEGARVYYSLKSKYENRSIDTAALKGDSLEEYRMWVKAKQMVNAGAESTLDLGLIKRALQSAQKSDSILRYAMHKDTFTGNDLDTFQASGVAQKAAKGGLIYLFRANQMMQTTNVEFIQGFDEFVKLEERKAEAREKAPRPFRKEIVGDNENDINDRYYGNNDVMASDALHGTHVSGIIAAVRHNNKGMDGVADNVRIMMIRAVPDGDEHDKDIALALRYAVDNGAKVVNMSFGKDFSPQKRFVDSAVLYALAKGVLLVHASGNDGRNNDSVDNYPTPHLLGGGVAQNMITVGASGDESAGGVTAYFSNYGKKDVDIFAPGVKIYSTFPGKNNYGNEQGTSMASPVVAGVAAFLLEYFPNLTVEQVKYCIEKSAQHPAEKVKKPGTEDLVDFSDISKSGGIINAYEAARVAYSLQNQPKENKNKRSPKSILKNTPG